MLGCKPGSGEYELRLPRRSFDKGHNGANGVPITQGASQPERKRVPDVVNVIAENPQLRSGAVLEDKLKVSVSAKSANAKCPAVIAEIEAHNTGHIAKPAVFVVGIKYVPLITAPGINRTGPVH